MAQIEAFLSFYCWEKTGVPSYYTTVVLEDYTVSTKIEVVVKYPTVDERKVMEWIKLRHSKMAKIQVMLSVFLQFLDRYRNFYFILKK